MGIFTKGIIFSLKGRWTEGRGDGRRDGETEVRRDGERRINGGKERGREGREVPGNKSHFSLLGPGE